MFKTNKQGLPVVFLAPSFQVSGVMTLPSFFSPIIIDIKCVEGQNKKHFEELAQDSPSPSILASLTTQIDFKINLYK